MMHSEEELVVSGLPILKDIGENYFYDEIVGMANYEQVGWIKVPDQEAYLPIFDFKSKVKTLKKTNPLVYEFEPDFEESLVR